MWGSTLSSFKTLIRFLLPEKQLPLLRGKSCLYLPPHPTPPHCPLNGYFTPLRNARKCPRSLSSHFYDSVSQPSSISYSSVPTARNKKSGQGPTPSLFIANPQSFPESQKMTANASRSSLERRPKIQPSIRSSANSRGLNLEPRAGGLASYLWVHSVASFLPPLL